MTTISVLGNKGGTGKTFVAVHLAWALQGKGKRVFFLDSDYAQCSGLKWLISQKLEVNPEKYYQINGIVAGLVRMKDISGEELQRKLSILAEKYDFLVIDGRPEPEITARILYMIRYNKENIIIFPCNGWDSVTQIRDIVEAINKMHLSVRMYGWLNQHEQARTSARIAEYFASLTITPCGIALPQSITVKLSEMESKPVWKVKGSGRTKFGVFFDTVATSLVMGRL